MRLRTIGLISILVLGLLAGPLPTEAQQAGKVYRIGYLTSKSKARPFWRGLRKLGYVEGQNIVIERRLAHGNYERYPKLVAELVNLKVDVIVTVGLAPALAAKKATTTIPIVVVFSGDAVGSGLVVSLARPGGNVTGFTRSPSGLGGKQLELLKQGFPSVSRVGVLWDPDSGWGTTGGMPIRHYLNRKTAEALGAELHPMEVGPANPDFEGAFEAAIIKRRVDAFIVVGSQFFGTQRSRILKLVTKTRLPAMYGARSWVRKGALMSYAATNGDLFRLAASYVDKILKGVRPADLPVQEATRFYLYINLNTAKKQKLGFSPEFLARADKVIK